MNYYILRYGEIALKGKNRGYFENKLLNNIKLYIKNRYILTAKITKIRGRLILSVEKEVDLRPIFGLTSYSKATKVEKDLNLIKDKALEEFTNLDLPNSFKVETHRIDKSFPMKSPDISKDVGEVIYEKFRVNVNFKNPEVIIGIEIHNDHAFVYDETVQCFGGLPLGCSGKVVVPIENNKRFILTALNLMRRGCPIIFLGEEKEIPIINLFNNYQSPKFTKESDIKTYASPNYFENLNKQENFLMLYPLVLLSDKEVEEELKKYEKTQK